MQDIEENLDIKEAAEYVGVSTKTIRRNIIAKLDTWTGEFGKDSISLESIDSTKKYIISKSVLDAYKKDGSPEKELQLVQKNSLSLSKMENYLEQALEVIKKQQEKIHNIEERNQRIQDEMKNRIHILENTIRHDREQHDKQLSGMLSMISKRKK